MDKDEKIQWHPAFADALKLELEEFKDILTFEEEFQLTMKPLEVDILVVKKTKKVPIFINIARIFEEHNIIEYKSPDDNISIDNFYKVLAYTYLYKVKKNQGKEISISDTTFTIAGYAYPRKLFKHLVEIGYGINKQDEGIYHIEGSIPKGQIIIIDQLPPRVNRFIRLLTRKINIKDEIEDFMKSFNSEDTKYEHLLEIIGTVNYEQFLEVYKMPRQLSQRELELSEQVIEKLGFDKKWFQKGIEKGIEKEIENGKIKTAKKLLLLNCEMKFIEKVTELSEEEILKIKDSIESP